MAGRLLLKEQVMTASSLCPIGQRRRLVCIVRENGGANTQVRLDGGEFLGLIVVGVQTVVGEKVYAPQLPQPLNGTANTAVNDIRPRFPDEIAGVRLDVNCCQPTMSISKQGGGNSTGPKAKVCTGFNDMFRLDGTDQGIPAEPSRPARLL